MYGRHLKFYGLTVCKVSFLIFFNEASRSRKEVMDSVALMLAAGLLNDEGCCSDCGVSSCLAALGMCAAESCFCLIF